MLITKHQDYTCWCFDQEQEILATLRVQDRKTFGLSFETSAGNQTCFSRDPPCPGQDQEQEILCSVGIEANNTHYLLRYQHL